MSRLTDGLDGPNPRNRWSDPQRADHRREAKVTIQRARCDAGVPYERIAQATGRSVTVVYEIMNVGIDRRQLTYADLIAMSRHSMTRSFVAHLLQPIQQELKGPSAKATP